MVAIDLCPREKTRHLLSGLRVLSAVSLQLTALFFCALLHVLKASVRNCNFSIASSQLLRVLNCEFSIATSQLQPLTCNRFRIHLLRLSSSEFGGREIVKR